MERDEPQLRPQPQDQMVARQQLDQIVHDSQDVLVSMRTVFPFDFFPDTVTVDRTQVTITHRRFFFMGGVASIRIADILNIIADVGPFFGRIEISTRYFDQDKPFEVRWLWRNDALRLKAIINGMLVALKENIDASNVASTELIDKAEELGQSNHSEAP